MTRQVLLRLLDTFFRRWWLYAVPLVLLVGLGVLNARSSTDNYRSAGTMNVEGATVLSELGNLRGDAGFGYATPAQGISQQMNSLLQTDSFVKEIVADAGLQEAVDTQVLTLGEVRRSLGALPDGNNLVRIGAQSQYPEVAQRLAQSGIDNFVQWATDMKVSQSETAEKFYAGQLPGYESEVTAAREALNGYLIQNPVPPGSDRPDVQETEVSRLNALIAQAETRYNTALDKREEARLSSEQTRIDVSQRLRLIDPPEPAVAPDGRLRGMVMSLAMFTVIGILLSLATVVVGLVLDRSICFPEEARERLGVRVLGVVPQASPSRRRSKALPPPTPVAPSPFEPVEAPTNGHHPHHVTDADLVPVSVGGGSEETSTNEGEGHDEAAASTEPPHRQHGQRRRPAGTRPGLTVRKSTN